MRTILIIDTNIWAYYFDKDSPEHVSVVSPVEAAIRSDQIAINTVMIMEVAHFLVKNMGPVEGAEKLRLFLRLPLLVTDFDYVGALDAIGELQRYSHLGVGGRDATILALMSKSRIKKIMTHDESLKRVDWVEPIDPVAAAGRGRRAR